MKHAAVSLNLPGLDLSSAAEAEQHQEEEDGIETDRMGLRWCLKMSMAQKAE